MDTKSKFISYLIIFLIYLKSVWRLDYTIMYIQYRGIYILFIQKFRQAVFGS